MKQFAVFLAVLVFVAGQAVAQPDTPRNSTPQPGRHPDPQTSDVSKRCTDNPTVSGCPGTGKRVLPPTEQRNPGNGEMLTSPTGMMTDTGAHAPPKEQDKTSQPGKGTTPPPVSAAPGSNRP